MNNEELISGLRTVSALPNLMGPAAGWCKHALDAIETLTRERDEAREALKEAKAVVDVAETMTSCGSDDDWIWGVQAKINAALAGGKPE